MYPGAQHTRFHHALGAMHLMGMAIDELRSKEIEISRDEEEAALIAVLLHDIGHSPYSHALEGSVVLTDHENLGKLLIRQLEQTFNGNIRLALQMFEKEYHRPFFHQLISGQLDLDRLDYLSRDSFYTGVAEGVVGHDRLLRMMHVVNDQLVIEEKGIHSIEKFLVARRIMYWQVYLHKTVLSAELMARNTIHLLREKNPETLEEYISDELLYFFKYQADNSFLLSNIQEVLPAFTDLDDVSIDYSFKKLRQYPDKAVSFLTRQLMARKLHKIQWSERPFDNAVIERSKKECMDAHNLSKSDADQLVWTGSETNTAYSRETEEIMILTKQGDIRPFSSYLAQDITTSPREKYFICRPC